MLVRRWLIAAVVVLLTACGTQAPPATSIPAPTATETSATAVSSNDSTTPGMIPQPPNSATYVDSTNAMIDEILIGVNEGIDQQTEAGNTIEQVHFMTSTDDIDTLINFYTNAMDSYGWDEDRALVSNQGPDPLAILIYPSLNNANENANITLFNLEVLHPTLEGVLIVAYVTR